MNEEQIIAYVDGELGPLEALRFERAIETDAALAAAVDRHRRLRETVASRFAPVAAEPVPDHLRRLIDRDPKVISFPARARGWSGRQGGYAALAATLVAGLVLGQLLPRAEEGPVGERGGRLIAQGALANALDAQLASAQGSDAAYRIGVSFRAGDGRYCRSFEGGAGAGLGCRGDRGWTLERFIAGSSGQDGDYRQAGSSAAEIGAAAQEMMAGEPLDAQAERQARDAGWPTARPAEPRLSKP
jgi:hypothetical protein